jgi:hypothetical protein
MTQPALEISSLEHTPASGAPDHHKSWFGRHKQLLIWTVAGVLTAGAAGAAGWYFGAPKPAEKPAVATKSTPTPTPTPTPSPETKVSPLTGLAVSPDKANLPIVGVMIENLNPDARPQSGLQNAGVVYEALAEGGITRFQAFFQDDVPPTIGPVRSLRPYYITWGLEFNSPVAHAGGSADALNEVGPLGMKDLNALSAASSGFYRSTDRKAPHNLYTTSDKLEALLARFNFNQPPNFPASPRKADSPAAKAPHPSIHMDFSYAGYQVDYKYDASTNDYARNLGGVPHIDRNTGKQIHVKNIVVEMASVTVADSYGHMNIASVGRGNGWVLRDGDAIPITWIKDSNTARTKLVDAAGKEVPLNAGNTWYEVVPIGKSVTF